MHIREHRGGFDHGFTEITSLGDSTGIALGVHKLGAEEQYVERAKTETAWLLMDGKVSINFDGSVHEFERRSLFDELPVCLHVAAGTEVSLTILEDSESSEEISPKSTEIRDDINAVIRPLSSPRRVRRSRSSKVACWRNLANCREDPTIIKKILTHLDQYAPSPEPTQLPRSWAPPGTGWFD